ncbi:helix-turn-helix domain-containing protein [Sanguibacter sp. 25GB23B1]|uniref:helix-turn-helix transcriptional regulator n=1 Tax=unclassified Sanguibacter TaxID=2645534 RepID=UPI0032AED449
MYAETLLEHGAAIWTSHGSGGAVVPADGCVDLILRDDEVLVAGPSTRWIATLADGDDGSLGLRLPPGRASGVLRLDLSEISDALLPLRDVLRRDAVRPLRAALLGARTGTQGAVGAVAGEARAEDRWTVLARRHATVGTPARQVAGALGVSERTFRRQMLAAFGYGYATLVRIERSRRAQALLQDGAALVDAAAGAGYADQPHLSREFRRMVGASPGQFAASAAKRSTELPSGSSSVA